MRFAAFLGIPNQLKYNIVYLLTVNFVKKTKVSWILRSNYQTVLIFLVPLYLTGTFAAMEERDGPLLQEGNKSDFQGFKVAKRHAVVRGTLIHSLGTWHFYKLK
jgi:hypothetical protein